MQGNGRRCGSSSGGMGRALPALLGIALLLALGACNSGDIDALALENTGPPTATTLMALEVMNELEYRLGNSIDQATGSPAPFTPFSVASGPELLVQTDAIRPPGGASPAGASAPLAPVNYDLSLGNPYLCGLSGFANLAGSVALDNGLDLGGHGSLTLVMSGVTASFSGCYDGFFTIDGTIAAGANNTFVLVDSDGNPATDNDLMDAAVSHSMSGEVTADDGAGTVRTLTFTYSLTVDFNGLIGADVPPETPPNSLFGRQEITVNGQTCVIEFSGSTGSRTCTR